MAERLCQAVHISIRIEGSETWRFRMPPFQTRTAATTPLANLLPQRDDDTARAEQDGVRNARGDKFYRCHAPYSRWAAGL